MFVISNRYNKSNESLKVKNDIIEKVGIDNIRLITYQIILTLITEIIGKG